MRNEVRRGDLPAATKTIGRLVHGFARNIDWRIVGLLAASSVPEAIRKANLRSLERRLVLATCLLLGTGVSIGPLGFHLSNQFTKFFKSGTLLR